MLITCIPETLNQNLGTISFSPPLLSGYIISWCPDLTGLPSKRGIQMEYLSDFSERNYICSRKYRRKKEPSDFAWNPPMFVLNTCHRWSWAFSGGCHSPVHFEMLSDTLRCCPRGRLLPERHSPLQAPSLWFPCWRDWSIAVLEMSLVEMLVYSPAVCSPFSPVGATCQV